MCNISDLTHQGKWRICSKFWNFLVSGFFPNPQHVQLFRLCIVHQVPQSHWHLQYGDPEHYSTHVSFKNMVKPRLSSMTQTPKQWVSGKEVIRRGKIHSLGWKTKAWVGGQCSMEKEHQSKLSSGRWMRWDHGWEEI